MPAPRLTHVRLLSLNGTATAAIPGPVPATGSYFVNVHASPSDLKTIAACGPLTRTTAPGSKAAVLGGR